MATRPEAKTKEERTARVLELCRQYGLKEYTKLHAILCIDIGWDRKSQVKFDGLIDTQQLAKRMDEITAEIIRENKRHECNT